MDNPDSSIHPMETVQFRDTLLMGVSFLSLTYIKMNYLSELSLRDRELLAEHRSPNSEPTTNELLSIEQQEIVVEKLESVLKELETEQKQNTIVSIDVNERDGYIRKVRQHGPDTIENIKSLREKVDLYTLKIKIKSNIKEVNDDLRFMNKR